MHVLVPCEIATPHQNYYLFQHIFFTLDFLAPKTTLCMKSVEMPALERYLKLRCRLLGRVGKTSLAKLTEENVSLSEVHPVLNNTFNYVPRAWWSLLKSSSHKMHPWGFHLHWKYLIKKMWSRKQKGRVALLTIATTARPATLISQKVSGSKSGIQCKSIATLFVLLLELGSKTFPL